MKRHWLRTSPGVRSALLGAGVGAVYRLATLLIGYALPALGENLATSIAPVFVGVYEIGSLAIRHPAVKAPYALWLRHTPWTWPQPLPLGRLGLGTGPLALALSMAALGPGGLLFNLALLGSALVVAHVAFLASTSAMLNDSFLQWSLFALACAAIASSVGPDGPWLLPFFLGLAISYPLSSLSTARVLSRWHELDVIDNPPFKVSTTRTDLTAQLGPPFDKLLIGIDTVATHDVWLKASTAILAFTVACEIACRRLVAWRETASFDELASDSTATGVLRYILALMVDAARQLRDNPRVEDFETQLICGAFLVLSVAASIVLLRRVWSYWPPIGLRGRFVTGRMIIPGYDRIFVGPAGSILTYFAVLALFLLLHASGIVAAGIALSVSLFVLGWLTPDLATWRLTGEHRIMLWNPTQGRTGNQRSLPSS